MRNGREHRQEIVEGSSRKGREMDEKCSRSGLLNGREIGERMIEKSAREWRRKREENDREIVEKWSKEVCCLIRVLFPGGGLQSLSFFLFTVIMYKSGK